jgi:vancomycin resistance protein YoaR
MPGVSAMGRSVGWLEPAEAAAHISPTLDAVLDRSAQLRYENRTWTVTSRDLGMKVDPAELAAAAYRVGREGNAFNRVGDQLRALAGGASVSIESGIDQAKFDALMATISAEIDRPPRDASVSISKEGTVEHVAARPGAAVDLAAARTRILKTLTDGEESVNLPVKETQPAITDELVQPAFAQVSKTLGGAGTPLTLTRGQESWPLERADVADLLSIEDGTQPGQPATIAVDDQKLQALVKRLAHDVDQRVQNARFQFNNGNLTVLRAAKEGREVDQPTAAALIKTKLLAGERTVELPVAAVQPAITSDHPEALGIVERIDSSSTSFAGSVPEKKWNIQLAAERLNGVVVPPGGTFSFNKELGPTTIESGFKWGFGIETSKDGARTVPSVGGGICQVATTLFHPVFWSGYQLEERYWHLYWIPAYTSKGTVGLDVTVDEDANLDFRWTNPTNDYVLIQSATDDSNVYFSLYGKKPPWKVEVGDAVITNRVPADTKPATQDDPTMPWGRSMVVQTARDGFDVVITRTVTPNAGGEPRTLRLRSKYQAVPTLTLVGTNGRPANAVTPTPSGGSSTPAPAAPSAATNAVATPATAPASAPAAVDQNRPVGQNESRPEVRSDSPPSLQGAVPLTAVTRPGGAAAPPPNSAPPGRSQPSSGGPSGSVGSSSGASGAASGASAGDHAVTIPQAAGAVRQSP